jgi:hypothetical protein
VASPPSIDECRWQDEPTSAIDHLAMNVIDRLLRAAISFTPFL